MSKNPVISKAKREAYNEGFKVGVKLGREQGELTACHFFASKFDGLDKVPGIGPKTIELIIRHFGKEYFEEVGK